MLLFNVRSVVRSFILDFAPPIFVRALRRFRAKDRSPAINQPPAINHPLGIELGPDRQLAKHYVGHRLYDRFLPVLCRHLPEGWIVDVGANVGDTAVAIARKCPNPILSVEASSDFFPLLERNTAGLPVRCVRAMAGTGRHGGQLVRLGPSASLSRSDTESSGAEPLDGLLNKAGIPAHQIVLIKTDTDGYDADVMLSAENAIRASEPILFWENQFVDDVQEQDLHAFYNVIAALGYRHIWIFDNFGNLMLTECGYAALRDLNRYIISQERNACTRTAYYTDVLAATDRHLDRARQAVSDYRTGMIERPQDEAV
jgi:FkbM family methyltransferase